MNFPLYLGLPSIGTVGNEDREGINALHVLAAVVALLLVDLSGRQIGGALAE
ncbi:hypothetical protein [Pseudomonas chlororaphis]|uniref:hypothetical protein n=1 Tax=Pseudomonas chlororaphis TaxID=587753 RepID=UPI00236704DD|nr:hypothetical protein [Pseudomonas chlororaphis]WDH20000.1 hypothetical protein PUP50_18425 [Pseudomonas chlororaphis]